MFTSVGPITDIYQDQSKDIFSHGFNVVTLNTSGIFHKDHKVGGVSVSTSLYVYALEGLLTL